ncbi:hypothetical protein [Streptococcus merionis]|uniref:Uncharacterized protein n=1 Tax=Streptococcus merionis TaxID=400065 RepID=A0A239SYN2_9STRE|nr:hypothetical protein [Streptococcus merionis]QBX08760.1 hypothetical protein JavanS294_0001 [Streptococcus satellite phage Javan294]SNU90625.1 Uncharacterised protein [Streptococcus merionis]
MNQAIKKRLAKLREQTTQKANGVVFVTHLDPGHYEVRHQNHTKDFTETVSVYRSEEEARQAVDKILQQGDYIPFWG